MLLHHFFEITSQHHATEELRASIRVNANHTVFEGHFPGAPVTPGVLQLQMVKEILAGHLGEKLRMTQLRQCKFLQVHDPSVDPGMELQIRYTVDPNGWVVQASGSGSAGTFFKLAAVYAKEMA